ARLRFWLSLVLEEEKPHALPNLDYKIMQGNSLLETFEGIELEVAIKPKNRKVKLVDAQINVFSGQPENGQDEFVFSDKERETLHALTRDYFNEEDKLRKQKLHAKIDRIVIESIHYKLDEYKLTIEQKLRESNAILKKKTNALKNQKQLSKLQNESKEA